MNRYKCYVYKGIVWEITNGEGTSFYECVPVADYLNICEKDRDIVLKQIKLYYDSALAELKSGVFNSSYRREMKKWRLAPLQLRLSKSDTVVLVDENVVSKLGCDRCCLKIFDSQLQRTIDVLKRHAFSKDEKEFISEIKNNIEPFLLSKASLFNCFKKYGSYKGSLNSDKNITRRVYRDITDFHENGIIFLEQFIKLDDGFLEDVLKKSSWVSVREHLIEDYPDF